MDPLLMISLGLSVFLFGYLVYVIFFPQKF
jgi:K+-transporting ATPase KdpF subunit